VRVWAAIADGDSEQSVPAYDRGLFRRDRAVSEAGAQVAKLTLTNQTFEPAWPTRRARLGHRPLLAETFWTGFLRKLARRASGRQASGLSDAPATSHWKA
jgi:hypothetical protein